MQILFALSPFRARGKYDKYTPWPQPRLTDAHLHEEVQNHCRMSVFAFHPSFYYNVPLRVSYSHYIRAD